MYLNVAIIAEASEISVKMWTSDSTRLRVVRFGDAATLHINEDRTRLEALQAALDEIRADMDAETARVAP